MPTPLPTHALFLDLETTGLTSSDTILEAAARLVIIDGLETVGDPVHALIALNHRATVADLRQWPAEVRAMHKASGLLDAVLLGETDDPQAHDDSPIVVTSLSGLDHALNALVGNNVSYDARVPLAGYGVSHMEAKGWIEKHLPLTHGRLTYWQLDVSGLRRTLQAFGFVVPEKGDGHRALLDVDAAIQEYRDYRSIMLSSDLVTLMGLVPAEEPF